MNKHPLPNLTFGPVPSRRLGRSLGINHIPPKTCTYACVYCQLGPTHKMQTERHRFYSPETIVSAVQEKVNIANTRGEHIDYLTFVPDGEPTLDQNLGEILRALKPLNIPLAVITNASLLSVPTVREALSHANWVSLKVDATDETVWRRVDRPHGRLRLANILAGAKEFKEAFAGQLVTETMLVNGINDAPRILEATAAAISGLCPNVAYLSIPTRPPAEAWVHPPDEAALNRAYQIFAAVLSQVELLIGYEGNAFAATGDVATDLLSITAVHPMRKDAVQALLTQANADWSTVQDLITQCKLLSTVYQGKTFYLRNLSKNCLYNTRRLG